MAIKQGATSVSEIEQKEEKKLLSVDINATGLWEGEEQEVDQKEDWQARSAPPPKGRYRLQFFPISSEKITDFKVQQISETNVIYSKDIMCKIVSDNEKVAGSIVSARFSTGIQKGKTKSSMYGVLELGGAKLPAKIKPRALAKGFSQWLAKEPILVADCDWQAWDTSDTDATHELGRVLLAGMDKFPKDSNGKPMHIIKNKKGLEFVAKLKIIKWIGKNQPTAGVNGSVQQAPVAQQANPNKPQQAKPAPAPVVEEEVMEIEGGGFEGVSLGDDGEVMLMD